MIIHLIQPRFGLSAINLILSPLMVETASVPDKLLDFMRLSMLSSVRTFGLSWARQGLKSPGARNTHSTTWRSAIA
jgi:hypothetical protein